MFKLVPANRVNSLSRDNSPHVISPLTLFSMQVEQLHAALDLQVNLMTCTEEELLISILTCGKVVAIIYNISSHKVTGVNSVNDKE